MNTVSNTLKNKSDVNFIYAIYIPVTKRKGSLPIMKIQLILFMKRIALDSEILMKHIRKPFDCSTWWYTQLSICLKRLIIRFTFVGYVHRPISCKCTDFDLFVSAAVGVLDVNNS
jgi:hypothetical protein